MSSRIDASGVIDRMRAAVGATRDAELAEALGLSGSAVSKWRQRNSVPLDAVLLIAERCGLSSDQLIYREPPEQLPPFGAHLRPRRAPAVDPDVLAIAMERAAQEWAAGHPGQDLVVFDLAKRSVRLYRDYFERFGGIRELAGELFDAMAIVLRPHLHWRLVDSEGGAKGGNSDEGGN